jgi:transcriptional regulator GlxA family with amidase domain
VLRPHEQHLTSTIRVPELALMIGSRKRAFSRLFKK